MIAFISFGAALLSTENVKCQSYSYQLSYGIDTEIFDWGTGGGNFKTIWDSGPVVLNDTLSPAQVLPFAWKFYGKDSVKQKKKTDIEFMQPIQPVAYEIINAIDGSIISQSMGY
jgi:hypothetical protein